MALNLPKPPKKGRDIVRAALSSLAADGAETTSAMLAGGSEQLDLAAPHKVYFVGLEDVAAGRALSAARSTGWRYIVVQGDEPMAAAELNDTGPGGGGLQFSQLNRGPFVGNTVEGVTAAEKLAAVKKGDYEMRLLKIPGLFVVALWLRGKGKENILMPLPPTRAELEAYRSYSEEEFFAALREAAYAKLQFHDEQHTAS
jgi:hypothetical protein